MEIFVIRQHALIKGRINATRTLTIFCKEDGSQREIKTVGMNHLRYSHLIESSSGFNSFYNALYGEHFSCSQIYQCAQICTSLIRNNT